MSLFKLLLQLHTRIVYFIEVVATMVYLRISYKTARLFIDFKNHMLKLIVLGVLLSLASCGVHGYIAVVNDKHGTQVETWVYRSYGIHDKTLFYKLDTASRPLDSIIADRRADVKRIVNLARK